MAAGMYYPIHAAFKILWNYLQDSTFENDSVNLKVFLNVGRQKAVLQKKFWSNLRPWEC